MILLDVNILVGAHREDASGHRETRAWLEGELRGPAPVAVTDLALSGFMRVVTHTRVFREPTPLPMALEFVENLREREGVRILAPGPRHWGIFVELCRRTVARGNSIPDAYHAAVAMEHGCDWITLDRGFARYPGLRWRTPFDGPSSP